MTATTSTSRKVLVPLATLLAAGAVVIGSGATWTSNSTSAVDVTAGSIIHTNSTDGAATLEITKLQPGESVSGTVKITNTGDLNADLTITQSSGATNTFSALGADGAVGGTGNDADVSDLSLTVSQSGVATPLYTGPFGGWTASNLDLGELAATNAGTTDETTLTFTVTLASWAANASQGATAGATFAFETTVAPGQTASRLGWNL